ncbi:MAG: hypothetical protein JWO15_3130 [Sphingomonadales bacterium]|nr:hypothetical protein [Sphingomonadales bacterium]
MIFLLTAMTSLGLIALGIGFIVLTLRDSGMAVVSALAGEQRFAAVRSAPRVRRVVRVRSLSIVPVPMRAAA